MFRIGEFSKLTQVTVRMLRYYDEMGLLKPAKIDPWTGYRMYTAEQIPALNKIIYLRDSGFQVAEIAEALKSGGDACIVEQLDRKYREIEKSIQEDQEKLNRIRLAKKGILHEKNDMHYQVMIKSVPSRQVLSLRKLIPDYYAEGELWKEPTVFVKQQQISVSDETFSIYHDAEYKEKDVDVELCVPVGKIGSDIGNFTYRSTESVPEMACTMVYGEFSHIAGAYLALAGWLQESGRYGMCGPSRQIVHRGPWNEKEPADYLTEIQIPLKTVSHPPLM